MLTYLQSISIVRVLLVGCLMMVFACTVAPVQKRDNIPARLPEEFSGSNRIESNSSVYWDQSFTSESLQTDVLTLLEANYELDAARARVKQAAATYGISRSAMIPSLDLKAEFKRSRMRESSGSSATTTEKTIGFGAALYWEPDIWGRIRARKKAASLKFEEQQAVADQIALNLQTLLVETWVTYHGAFLLEQVLKEQQKINKQVLDLTELRFAQGDGNALDVLMQRRRLAAIDRTLPGAVSEQRRAANANAVLLGRFPDCDHRPDGEWPVIKRLSEIPTPRMLIAERPDLRAAFLSLQAADHEVSAAIADRLPAISIGVNYTASGKTFSNIGNDTALNLVSGLLVPVFDAGRLKAKASLKKARALEAVSILEQAMLVAVREVEDALIQENAFFDEHRLLQQEIEIASETVEEARLMHVNGQESFLSVLVASVTLQTLQQDEIALKQELLINRGRLLKALGAKWSQHREKNENQ